MICRGFFLHSNIYNSINLFAVCLPVTNILPIFAVQNYDSSAIPMSSGYCSHIKRWAFFVASPAQPNTAALSRFLLLGVTIVV